MNTGNASHQTPFQKLIGFNEYKWTISFKTSKELKSFDDRWESYEGWYARMREHAAQTNQRWLKVFDLIERTDRPIKQSELSELKGVPGLEDVDWEWVSIKLWTFIGDHVTDLIHMRRVQLTLGEEFNGAELWRALHVRHKGGAEQMTLAGMSSFLNFPKRTKIEDLQNNVGEWHTSN